MTKYCEKIQPKTKIEQNLGKKWNKSHITEVVYWILTKCSRKKTMKHVTISSIYN